MQAGSKKASGLTYDLSKQTDLFSDESFSLTSEEEIICQASPTIRVGMASPQISSSCCNSPGVSSKMERKALRVKQKRKARNQTAFKPHFLQNWEF